jgi:branched-subunit amino acid transport protein
MDVQAIIAYILVAGAVVFLARRFFFRKKKKSGNCGNDDCGCR